MQLCQQLTLTDKIKKLAEQSLSESERNEKVHVPATEKLEALVEEALKSTATPSPELLKEFCELLGALLFIFITVRVEIGYAITWACCAVSGTSRRPRPWRRRSASSNICIQVGSYFWALFPMGSALQLLLFCSVSAAGARSLRH